MKSITNLLYYMSKHQHAIIRYLALDKCFRNTMKKYFIEDLQAACNEALLEIKPESSGIQKRQLYKDILFMQDPKGYDAPIEKHKEGRNVYYRYADPGFSINKRPLNEQEATQLQESLQTLMRFKGLPQFGWIDEMSARLTQEFGLNIPGKIIDFDDNPDYIGREHIATLYHFIVNQIAIELTYQPYNKNEYTVTVSPYYLKQYNHRWFLIGHTSPYSKLTVFALDRICEIKPSGATYIPDNTIDFNEYFDDMIGVTILDGATLENVVLRIAKNRWKYVETKPIHGSQTIVKREEEHVCIRLKLYINQELLTKILSFGKDIEVIEPEHLRQTVAEEVSNMYSNYF